jgi:NTP pyrophosphatase (non-canonical NTP hydrolase)
MKDTAALQRTVYESVKARGYADGWTPEQFAARQVAKAGEELAEYSACFSGLPPYVTADVQCTGQTCRQNFKMPELWHTAKIDDIEQARKELADLLVSVLSACEVLEFDGLQAAIDKSAADIARGVR